MKHCWILCLIGLAVWWAGCASRSPYYPPTLRLAEACVSDSPDHALTLLQSMADSIDLYPEEIRMYYHLLTLQAEDRQYIIHTDDSLINVIVRFYEKQRKADARLMLAYYLQGKVYSDLNDAPQALNAFRQALGTKADDWFLSTRIYDEMRLLYANQGLYEEVILTDRKLLEVYTLQGMHKERVSVLRGTARIYEQRGESDSAIHYYQEACRSALEIQDSAAYYGLSAELTGLLYRTGEGAEVLPVLRRAALREDIADKSYIYFMLSQIYKEREMWDSAYYYNQRVIESGNIEKAYYSYRDLYVHEKRNRNYEKALEYVEKALDSRSLIQNISQREASAQINSLFNYQRISNENAKLKLNREKQKNIILILVLLLSCIAFGGFVLLSYVRKKNRFALERVQQLKQIAEENYARSQDTLQANEAKLRELAKQQEKAVKDNNLLKSTLLETEMKKLRLHNENILLAMSEEEQCVSIFVKSELYEHIQQAAADDTVLITDEDWLKIQDTIDFMYPTFNEHLSVLFPNLPTYVRQLCWLTKIGLQPGGIARILNRSKQAITNMRAKLSRQVHASGVSEGNFDEFIASLS